jgi:8-oxo-dGTP pyrophosphatase MutT (NUDIX family)
MRELGQKLILSAIKRSHRWRRALTLGARVAVFDAAGKVLLVKHTYQPGWIFPGGGVEFGETAIAAAIREIDEEAGILAESDPELFGIYSNHSSFPGDHLLFYTLRKFRRTPWQPNREIAAAEFFPPSACPEGTTDGTLRRLAEIADAEIRSPLW